MKKSKRPEIYFKGHEQDYVSQSFADSFDMMSNNTLSRDKLFYGEGIAKNIHYGDILTVFGEYVDVAEEKIQCISDDEVYYKFQSSALKSGDIVIADTAEDEAVGKCIEIQTNSENVLAGLHTIPCRPKGKYAEKYLGYYMNSNAYHKKLIPLMQGVKVMSISRSGIQGTEICVTEDFYEQEKIGKFLFALDEKIKHEQEKLEKIKMVKKAILCCLFPATEGGNPRVRFKGFEDDWQKYKVNDLLEERNVLMTKSEEYPLMAFIANEGVAPKGDRYNRDFLVSDVHGKKYKMTEKGDFIYSSNNLETGSIGLNKYGSAVISPVYSIFSTTELADSDFIGRSFQRKDFINEMVRWRQGVVYGQWRIHENDFLQIKTLAPSVQEQEKIGKLFDKLDRLIELFQEKIMKMTNIKSACTNKMFI